MPRSNLGHFTVTRLRPGYAMAEVDDFITRIEGTLGREPLAAEPVTADDVRRVQFTPTRLHPGYDELEVDAVLESYEQRLRGLAGAQTQPAADPDAALSAGLTAVGESPGGALVRSEHSVLPGDPGTSIPPSGFRFTRTKFRTGYTVDEVDDFITRIEGTLGLGPMVGLPVTAEDVNQVRFHTVLVAPGYDEQEVDAVLDRYEAELRLRQG